MTQSTDRLRELSRGELNRLVQAIKRRQAPDASAAIRRRPAREGPFPLSLGQERLWFLERLRPGNPRYVMAMAGRIEGALDRRALAAAIGSLAMRHQILGATFLEQGGLPVQSISAPKRAPLPVVDLGGIAPRAGRREAAWIAARFAQAPFDLAAGPLLRARLVDLGGGAHQLLVSVHHIVADGWSVEVMLSDLAALYEAFAAGHAPQLEPLPIQFWDYAAWQREAAGGGEADRSLAAWRQRLVDLTPLELPRDATAAARGPGRGGRQAWRLDHAAAERLNALAAERRVTLFPLLLGLYGELLKRLTGCADVAIASPVAGRDRPLVEGLIGFFANTLVFRCPDSTGLGLGELAGPLAARVREDLAIGDVPFERVVREVAPERAGGEMPLTPAVLSLEPSRAPRRMGGVTLDIEELPTGHAKFDLLMVARAGDRLEGYLEYDASRFEGATVQRWARAFERLVAAATQWPDRPLQSLSLLAPAERHQIRSEWNDTEPRVERPGSIPAAFALQATLRPEGVALVLGDRVLSYGELARRSGRVAAALLARGLTAEDPVALDLPRGLAFVVAALGVLEAGGAYLPLDRSYPQSRLRFMLDDAGARLLLTDREGLSSPLGAGAQSLVVGAGGEVPAEEPAGRDRTPPCAPEPDAAAYVMYTSGSTGRPKGVVVSHRAVCRLVLHGEFATLDRNASFLQLAPSSFDASTLEIWGPLLNGGRVVVAPAGALSLDEIGRQVERHRVRSLWLTAGLFHQMVDHGLERLAGLDELLAGGDVLSAAHVRKALEALPGLVLINGYGPTENTTFTCCHRMARGRPAGAVPIGRPIASSRVTIADAGGPVPVGVPGELLAAGTGLARCYLNRPALTAERFVPDAQAGRFGERLYRTGDQARWLADGRIEFLGRRDHQVKLRGFRIELGEVESALRRIPEVSDAVAVIREVGDDAVLAAYVVGRDLDPPAIGRRLADDLPPYMVPSFIVPLESLPQTANGKVDRRALPEPRERLAASAGEGPAWPGRPSSPIEEMVAGIMAELLDVPEVGLDQDFFELGGHSLAATRLVAALRQAFGLELPLAAVFEAPTVRNLAQRCAPELAPAAERSTAALTRSGVSEAPLSYAQERLWFLDRFEPETSAYNLSTGIRLSGALDLPAMAKAVRRVVRRHESLRTVFRSLNGRAMQLIVPARGLPLLEVTDLSGLEEADREALAEDWAANEARLPFDLGTGPLVRLRVARLARHRHVLCCTLHHIIADGWSTGVLIGELSELYSAQVEARPASLPRLPVQYADYALWQRSADVASLHAEQMAYWREQLAGAPPALDLPTDLLRPATQRFEGGRVSRTLDAGLDRAVRKLGRQHRGTLFMTLLAALQILLSRLSGQADVVVGAPIAGRRRLEVEGLIGMFLNSQPLRTEIDLQESFVSLLARVRGIALEAYRNQDVPFERLLAELSVSRDLSRTPIFQVFLNVLNFPREEIRLSGLEAETLRLPEMPSKFDLTLYADEAAEPLHFDLVYNARLFSRERMEELLSQLEVLLGAIVDDPELPVGRHSLLTPGAAVRLPDPRQALEAGWPGSVHEVFGRRAAQSPQAAAVIDVRGEVSYAAVDRTSARIAGYLAAHGVGLGDVVAIYGHRSAPIVWAVLGILRAGAAFTILDPLHPPARLAAYLESVDARGWIEIAEAGPVPAEVEAVLLGREHAPRLRLEPRPQGREPWENEPGSPPRVTVTPDDVAYVAFTSGSTGTPKGILGRHGPLSHFVPWQAEVFALGPDDRFSLLSGLAHDPLQRDLFTPLQLGAAVVIPDPRRLMEAGWLGRWVAEQGVTVVHLTPTMSKVLAQAEGEVSAVALRYAFLVGEELTTNEVLRLKRLAPSIECVNFFGSTETQRAVGYHRVSAGELVGDGPRVLPLGRGMPNVQLLVLNGAGELAGVGEVGEVSIRSPHLARGYLNDPERTAERFVTNPLGSGGAEDRLYRTGDLGRYRWDGEVVFAGRADRQVKIRGFRIEPGEIEAALAQRPDIEEAVVVTWDDRRGERRLVAYVVPAPGAAPEPAELREELSASLPAYMVPSLFIPLERLPLTANRKLDRSALPSPESYQRPTAGGGPRTRAEAKVAAIWEECLGIAGIGKDESFFEVGGHSLLLLEVQTELQRSFDRAIPVAELFRFATIREQAKLLSDGAEPAAAEPRGKDRSALRRAALARRSPGR